MPETVIVIESGSEAFKELLDAFAQPDTYKISLEVRTGGIAIKRNEAMWSPTLEAVLSKDDPARERAHRILDTVLNAEPNVHPDCRITVMGDSTVSFAAFNALAAQRIKTRAHELGEEIAWGPRFTGRIDL